MAREATSNTHIRFPRFSHPSDDTARIGARSSGLSNPADDVEPRSSESHTANASLSQWYDFEFERELFQSSVYSRNVQRTASVSTTRSTITAHTCSILSHLSLADVSVVSVLRLPVETRKLSNESSYDLQRRRSEVSRTGPARLQQSATPQECGNFGENIAELAKQAMEHWEGTAKASTIFKGLSILVASCILVDVMRQRSPGRPEEVFPRYVDHLDNALEEFCNNHLPCEYIDAEREDGKCVLSYTDHRAKEHRSKTGLLLAEGFYCSSFSFESVVHNFRNSTYFWLADMTARLSAGNTEGVPKEQSVVRMHQDLILPAFFRHVSRGDVRSLTSQTVCFSCLMKPPQHELPCGHIFCKACISRCGTRGPDLCFEVSVCPIEGGENCFVPSCKVYL
jgi:hypothetical protein